MGVVLVVFVVGVVFGVGSGGVVVLVLFLIGLLFVVGLVVGVGGVILWWV